MPAPPKPTGSKAPIGKTVPTGSSVGFQSSVETGPTISEAAKKEAITETGIIAYSFYSLTNASGQMLRPGAASALSVVLPFRGSVLGLVFKASTACTGTYTVHINGTATNAAVIASAEASDYKTWIKGTYGFSAGDTLDVRATGVATAAIVELIAYVLIDPTTTL